MGWYRFCKRIGFINNVLFQKSNAFNLVLILLPLYELTIFLSCYLKVYYGFNYEAAQLIIGFSFILILFIFRPIILIIYNRYYFKWDILRSLQYFSVDLLKFVKETQWLKSFKLIIAYFAYAFFSAFTIFLYIDGIIGKLSPKIARAIFVHPVLDLSYNNQNVETIYIIIYFFFIAVLSYPLLSIIESSLRNVHPKWHFYSFNPIVFNIITMIIALNVMCLTYFKYVEQNDILELPKISHDEFYLLQNSMIDKAGTMFFGLLFFAIIVIIIIDDYRMTGLYLRNKKNK